MKTLNINCPEGYEINLEKSNLEEGIIEFKEIDFKKEFPNILGKLSILNKYWYIDGDGLIEYDEMQICYLHRILSKQKK